MQIKESISAFFPCYNDGGTIASMVILMDRTLRDLEVREYEIIVIDDGSNDHARKILNELEKKYPNLRTIFHEKNRGYGGALRSGFAHAKNELIFYTDGDFQYDVTEIKKLLSVMNDEVDIVNGYKKRRSDPLHRRIIGRIYHWMVKILFGIKIRDVDCDFRLIRKKVIEKIILKENSGAICLEMIKNMQDAGFKFVEIPVSHFFRSYGKSQFFNIKRIFQVAASLLRLWWRLVIKKEAKTRHETAS
jgi:glycosyltransferase involved in cell wall biosynthesis